MKRQGLDWLSDMLYPADMTCAFCGREIPEGEKLCPECAQDARRSGEFSLPGLDGCAAGFLYEGALRGAIHAFKYENQRWLARFFAAAIPLPALWRPTALISVPLHPRKLRERGYNQSALLCAALGARYKLPVREDILVRVRDTRTQTELAPRERARNMQNAFAVRADCTGGRLVLVDDVCTTGSTLCACASVLRASGAAAVYALSAAVVL